MDKIVAFILSLFFAFLSMYLWQLWRVPSGDDVILDNVDAPDILAENSKAYDEPEVIQVGLYFLHQILYLHLRYWGTCIS